MPLINCYEAFSCKPHNDRLIVSVKACIANSSKSGYDKIRNTAKAILFSAKIVLLLTSVAFKNQQHQSESSHSLSNDMLKFAPIVAMLTITMKKVHYYLYFFVSLLLSVLAGVTHIFPNLIWR